MTALTPLETYFDTAGGCELPLPSHLARLYGRLRFPTHPARPHVIGNFVSTLDGVVSLGVEGNASGQGISGANPYDRMVMGLLRAAADSVIVGAGTYRASSGRNWIAERAFPALAEDYRALRRRLGKPDFPLNIIVSAHGDLDLTGLTSSATSYLIVTTDDGANDLGNQPLPPPATIVTGGASPVSATHLIDLATRAQPGGLILVEGGPHLMSQFVAERCLDELFLTIAPQIAGRDSFDERPGLIAGRCFAPADPRWGTLNAVKRAGGHLFLRYAFTPV